MMNFELLGNIYFIVALIFCLMILDYSLTLLGQKYYKKYLQKYIQIESYELNPIFQDSIEKRKYDLRHVIGVILILAFILFLFYFEEKKIGYEFIVGFAIILYINVVSQHLRNIATSKFIAKHNELLIGKIEYKIGFSYYASTLQFLSIFLILLIIFIFKPSTFLFGGIVCTLIIGLKQFMLFKKAAERLNTH